MIGGWIVGRTLSKIGERHCPEKSVRPLMMHVSKIGERHCTMMEALYMSGEVCQAAANDAWMS